MPATPHLLRDGFSVGQSLSEFDAADDEYVDLLFAGEQSPAESPTNSRNKANSATHELQYGLDAPSVISDNAHQLLVPGGNATTTGQSLVRSLGPLQKSKGPSAPPAPPAMDGGESINNAVDIVEPMIPLHKVNWEYHGPWSWVSVCSPPGVAWVCEKTNSNEFEEIASCFMKTWSKRLKVQRSESLGVKFPEPDPETAWKYVNAFFEDSTNAIFGTLIRSTFEARLRQHFHQTHSSQPEDPAWFALRNAVYAIGCRCLLASSTSLTFEQTEGKAWQLFCNALSVFGEMIFSHSGLTAIQALTVMTFYAMGLASPCLEYPMCKNAVQLAQAKGLHREPSASWGLSPADLLTRNWLWWTIYIIDKQVSLRSGRPSSIDDDDISTSIPTATPPGSGIDAGMVTLIIKHAQICSQVSTRIMSVKASKQGFDRVYDTVQDIQSQLEALLETIPSCLDKIDTAGADRCANRRLLSTYLYSDVYSTIMATHVVFFYPWISSRLGSKSNPLFQEQAIASANTIAYSARQIILQLKTHLLDVSSSTWATFFLPMNAYINLLVYVLKEPDAATARGDLALLDVAAGHFGQLEHVTGGILAFDFPRDCNALCLRTMRATKVSRSEAYTVPATPQVVRDDPSRDRGTLNASADVNVRQIDNVVVDGLSENMNIDDQFWTVFGSIDIPDEFTESFL